MMRFIFLYLLFFTAFSQTILLGQDFSEWRSIGRTGVYKNEINLLKTWPKEGPNLIWYTDSIPKGYASVAVANSRLYTTGVSGETDVVLAFDLQGNHLWTTPYGRKWDNSYDESRCTPTVEGERLFVLSGLGDIACVNALSGEIEWQLKANDEFKGAVGKFGFAESLLLVDDYVIFTPGGDYTTMVALDKFTGSIIWKSDPINDNASYTSPVLIENNGEKIISTVTENYFIGEK